MIRLAVAIVRWYPAAWRERYEAEVSALLEDSPPTLNDLSELLRGLVTERARELVSSDDQPRRTAAVLVWMPAAFNVLFMGAAIGAGIALRTLSGSLSEAQQENLGMAAVVSLLGLIGFKIAADIRHARRPRPKPPSPRTPPWVAFLLLPWVFLTLVCASWADMILGGQGSLPWWLHAFSRTFVYLMMVHHLTASLWPHRDLLRAIGAIEHAETQIRTNETWVRGCREMIAKGVPSPLEEALAQVGRWTLERDAARARLQELGYRARFRTPS